MKMSGFDKKLKTIRELQNKSSARREQGLFVVEGRKMVEEIPEDRLAALYVSESYAAGQPVPGAVILPDRSFERISDTVTPQGILALVKMEEYHLTGQETSFLILDHVQDPGNVGTIIRTAEAAGIDCVICSRDTADVYNPKTVRSTMGTVFRQHFLYTEDLPTLIRQLPVRVYGAHLQGVRAYDEPDYREPTAFLIGNESVGLRKEVADCARELIRIPMSGKVESLNAGIAASILAFELARQRRG